MIYFLQADIIGRIKIGYSRRERLEHRIMALQTASPVPLKLLATCQGKLETERRLHARFADHRIIGEWFDPCPRLVRLIAKLQGKAYRRKRRCELRPLGHVQSAILEYLRVRDGTPVSARAVANGLGDYPDKVRVILHRLYKRRLVIRIGDGWAYPVEVPQ